MSRFILEPRHGVTGRFLKIEPITVAPPTCFFRNRGTATQENSACPRQLSIDPPRFGKTRNPRKQLPEATAVCNKVNRRPVELLCNTLVGQVLYGPNEWEESKLFHTMPVLVDEVPPTINGNGHGHFPVCPYPGTPYVASLCNQKRGKASKDIVSLTWDKDGRVPGVDPVVRPNIHKVFG